jgi:ABC-type polysaccharide/polyol phosphate transport system ATPase subunit
VTQPPSNVVDVQHVFRTFRVDHSRRTLFQFLKGSVSRRDGEAPFRTALNDVTLKVQRGEKLGIIGHNAAGKSTLLKIIAGLLRPSSGTVRTTGEKVLLTSLGVGMIDDVSVVDNSLMYGALYGIEPARMRAVLDDVLEWAEIKGYEDQKLKTLSTGTRARLAFSVVRHIDADIFLMDEALSAGDVTFSAKCRAYFEEPRNNDRTFLVATHDMDFVRSFCAHAIWLHGGRILAIGESSAVVDDYLAGTAPEGGLSRSSVAAR